METPASGHDHLDYLRRALALADRARASEEVPVGALLVLDGRIVGEGWNQPISANDPSAHAEIVALRDAGRRVGNYRLTGSVLYVTLEPCVMCAGAIIHARVDQVVFGAADPKAGACGSVFDLLPSDSRFNHRTACCGPAMPDACGEPLKAFFAERRARRQDRMSRTCP